MIKLGHEKDLQGYTETYIGKTCGSAILNDICKLLIFLDDYYGSNRNVYNSDGGYVVVLKDKDEWEKYNKETSGMLERNNYDSFFYFDNNFVRVDYLVNNETVISVYMLKELFKE